MAKHLNNSFDRIHRIVMTQIPLDRFTSSNHPALVVGETRVKLISAVIALLGFILLRGLAVEPGT